MFEGKNFSKKSGLGKVLRLSVMAAIILGFIVSIPLVATAADTNPVVVPVDSDYEGLSYGNWSAKWWQWALSIPAPDNPLLDTSGEKCGEGQSGNVWFLAGTFGGSAERTCTVPAGKAILFPIINAECSTVEGNGKTEEELSACAKDLIDHVRVKEAKVDGMPLIDLNNYRVQSPLFRFRLPPNNILGLSPGSSPSVSDGYWILLEPLSTGPHTIHFRGVAPFPEFGFTFKTEVTYTLTVE